MRKNKPVTLIYCTDERSGSAATLLCEVDFCDVRVLHGGMERWNQNGLPPGGQGRPNVGRRAGVIEYQT